MSEGGLKRVYDHCLMTDPDGRSLAYINNDKKDWYLKKELATLISESDSDSIIRLKFHPEIKEEESLRSIVPKDNKCACCGSQDKLSRHHMVPSVFLRHLPEKFKEHKSAFVVCLCVPCHRIYEEKVISFKKEVAKKYNVTMFFGHSDSLEYLNTMKMWKNFHIILYSKRSEEEKNILKEELIELGHCDFSNDGLLKGIEQTRPKVNSFSIVNWPKALMEKIMSEGEESIKSFIIMWFVHFSNTMNPNIKLPFEEVENGI